MEKVEVDSDRYNELFEEWLNDKWLNNNNWCNDWMQECFELEYKDYVLFY